MATTVAASRARRKKQKGIPGSGTETQDDVPDSPSLKSRKLTGLSYMRQTFRGAEFDVVRIPREAHTSQLPPLFPGNFFREALPTTEVNLVLLSAGYKPPAEVRAESCFKQISSSTRSSLHLNLQMVQ